MIIRSGIINNIKYEVENLNGFELLIKVINYNTRRNVRSIVNQLQDLELDEEINRLIINSKELV